MKTVTPEELAAILALHKQWLDGKEGGERANLSYTNLQGANLYRANLYGVDLRGANLYEADLYEADLYEADLRGANLYRANLYKANLTEADLYKADLTGADLTGADLTGADLYGAKMNWQSHGLIAELLRRHAGDDPEKRKVAGLILLSRDWCWKDFQKKCGKDPLFAWAIETLRQYVQDGDDTPDLLREEAGL